MLKCERGCTVISIKLPWIYFVRFRSNYLKNVFIWDLKDLLKRCKYIDEPITQDQIKEFWLLSWAFLSSNYYRPCWSDFQQFLKASGGGMIPWFDDPLSKRKTAGMITDTTYWGFWLTRLNYPSSVAWKTADHAHI